MRGGHNRRSDTTKIRLGTYRPDRAREAVTPLALTRWPPPPRGTSAEVRAAWRQLGRSLLPLGVISSSDLLTVEQTAHEMARVAALRRDPKQKTTALNAAVSNLAKMFQALGLSPGGRAALTPLPVEAPTDAVPAAPGQTSGAAGDATLDALEADAD